MCKSWDKEVYREKGQPGLVVVQNYGLVRCEAGPVGGEVGEVNRVFQ